MQQPRRPAGRYGDESRPRPGVVAGIVVLAAAFVSWVVWAALGAAAPEASADVVGFRVLSATEIRVRVAVVADADRSVVCAVRAQDRTRETVGVTDAVVPAGDDREVSVLVRTRARAVTAVVGGCRADGTGG